MIHSFKRSFAALLALAIGACASTPALTPPPNASVESLSVNRFRVTTTSTAGESDALLKDRALLRAARLTLDRGEEWFEVTSEIAGDSRFALIVVTGSGETLAGGGSRIHDARETVRRLQSRVG